MESTGEPLVSVVTPCLNGARFLEETIRSVLDQDYPRIEYIVMDGGSTDGTLDILRKYQDRLQWFSAPDRGQADAVNRGFQKSTGSVFTFINADDTFLPGAVAAAVRHLATCPEAAGVYGEAWYVDEFGRTLRRYETCDFDPELFRLRCFICQPAVFLRREAFVAAGMLDADLSFALDYDLWIRVSRRGALAPIPEYLATFRVHKDCKTLKYSGEAYHESARVVRKHFGYVPPALAYGYICALLAPRRTFLELVPPSPAKYALSLVWGSLENRGQLARYWKEWWAVGTDAWRRGAWKPRVRP